MRELSFRATLGVRKGGRGVTAVARRNAPAPKAAPAPARHLRLVPPPEQTPHDESRRVREARWTTALLSVATLALIVLWTAALLGAADESWWPPLFVAVFAGVVAFGVLVLRKTC
jgi:hypothetical protein